MGVPSSAARHARLVKSAVAGGFEKARMEDERIWRSWRRCLLDYHLDPATQREPRFVTREELEERRQHLSSLMPIARVEMANLYQQVAGSGYAILLTDGEGVVLNYVGDPKFSATASQTGLSSGAVWSEEIQGTNGMGTCLVERQPVVVHHSQHFLACNTLLTCSAAPIFGPQGEPMAVLDASSESSLAQEHTKVLVKMSAQMIENRVFLSSFKDDYVLRFHSRPEFVTTLGEGVIAVSGEGCVLAANRNALFQLGLSSAAELHGKPIEEVFEISLTGLMGLAVRHPFQPLPVRHAGDGRRFFAIVRGPSHEEHLWIQPAAPTRRGEKQEELPCELRGLDFGDRRMGDIIRCAQQLVQRDIPLILYGETGSGKGVLAKALHQASHRADKPFVGVNCAAIPETLIESELFGYRPGAFTGASRHGSRGKIEQANGGTLFLDEIGDMPIALQARLLQVLEDREVIPLGGETPVKVDINVISATHRNLPDLIAQGRFREDLYYRLHGMSLVVPPLRERTDKRALTEHLVSEYAGDKGPVSVESAAMDLLERHHWPGNIRQLCNVLRATVALLERPTITPHDLPAEIRAGREADSEGANGESTSDPLAAAEREALLRELETKRWNVTLVADALKVSRNTLYRKMRRYGIRRPR
ncbi:MAG: sigma-54-dependent Fis family transcriptional regulator [Gammaproteobacteria bacterium]|nr:sigma-54-dependent Fis family transcriptional regulator [Gammaproteobacteria bacterium]